MDARTGVQRQPPSKPTWIVNGERSSRVDAAAIVDESVANSAQAPECEDRLSVDPLRSTDRYRLVMPYAEEV